MASPDTTQIIELAIKAPPEQIWNAIVDGSITPAYYVGFQAEFDLEPGAPYRYTADGADMITGEVLEVESTRTLRTTFNGKWDPDVAGLPESRVTFSLLDPSMPMPGVTVLSLVHEDLPDNETAASLRTGWVAILSGLKTLLETGAPMVSPVPAGV